MSEDEYDLNNPSASDFSSEEDDSDHHEELLSTISTLGNKRKRVSQRSEAAVKVSEHHLNTAGGVRVGDLLRGVQSPALTALQQRLVSTEQRSKPLSTPLSRVKADQIQRGVAYVESCKQAGKWAPIVKKNREAEHLSFPLQEDRVALPSLTSKVENFEPQTEFEHQIAAVLASSDNVETNDEELTQAEHEALMRVSLEEAAERRKELQKMRALISYYEQKARRTKKIKSKKFHRLQRKRREAKQMTQTEDSEDLVNRAERLRAEERMTLKHSRMSKWARQQLSRTHKDSSVQEALADHHLRAQSLKHKPPQESSSCDEDAPSDTEEQLVEHISGNPWLGHSGTANTPTKQISTVNPVRTTQIPPTPVIGTGLKLVSEDFVQSQLMNVQEAFAGDNVVREFEEEKEQLMQDSRAKTIDLTMPGWGTWGGEGVKPPRKARKIVKKIPEKLRRDTNKKNVIISECIDKKISKHLVKDVPWPYTSREQFDKTNSAPVGRHWNTEATFHSTIRPRVTAATGCVIEPIKLTEDVQDFIKRTQKRVKAVVTRKKKSVN